MSTKQMEKTTKQVADEIVGMAKAGNINDIGPKYWADDVVSIEAMEGPMAHLKGRKAAEGKAEWWSDSHEIHSVETTGPSVNGDQFTIHWKMDVTQKDSGNRIGMEEIALYTIKDGKIAEERFFY